MTQDQSIDTQSVDSLGGGGGGDCWGHGHDADMAVVARGEKEPIEVALRGCQPEVAAADRNGVAAVADAAANDDEDDGDNGACTTKDTTPGDATDDEAIDTQM